MTQISKATRVVNRASSHVMGALERAKGSLADIPLGETKLDPRTEKKRAAEMPSGEMDTTLSRILYDMRGKYDNTTGGQE